MYQRELVKKDTELSDQDSNLFELAVAIFIWIMTRLMLGFKHQPDTQWQIKRRENQCIRSFIDLWGCWIVETLWIVLIGILANFMLDYIRKMTLNLHFIQFLWLYYFKSLLVFVPKIKRWDALAATSCPPSGSIVSLCQCDQSSASHRLTNLPILEGRTKTNQFLLLRKSWKLEQH